MFPPIKNHVAFFYLYSIRWRDSLKKRWRDLSKKMYIGLNCSWPCSVKLKLLTRLSSLVSVVSLSLRLRFARSNGRAGIIINPLLLLGFTTPVRMHGQKNDHCFSEQEINYMSHKNMPLIHIQEKFSILHRFWHITQI